MVDVVDSKRAYTAADGHLLAGRPRSGQSLLGPGRRLNRATALLAIFLSSISLWAAIWAMVASFVSP